MSREHFTVNGTLIKVWAGQESVLPKRKHRRHGATPRGVRIPIHSEHSFRSIVNVSRDGTRWGKRNSQNLKKSRIDEPQT